MSRFYKFLEIKISDLGLVACREPLIKITYVKCFFSLLLLIITMRECYPVIGSWKLRTDYMYEDKCRKEVV